jgi:hypothetical protein
MWTTEADVRAAMNQAIQRSAAVAGISTAETGDVITLFEQIENANPVLHVALTDFLKGLAAWYFAHVEIERTGSSGRLNPEQAADLSRKINDKRLSHETLLTLLRSAE